MRDEEEISLAEKVELWMKDHPECSSVSPFNPYCYAQYFFSHYEDILQELQDDIHEFFKSFPARLHLRHWRIAGLREMTSGASERYAIFGSVHYGLGHYIMLAYDRHTKKMVVITEEYTQLKQYTTWTEAISDLLAHDFEDEYLKEEDVGV